MRERLTIGLNVRVNQRCALSDRVPSNSRGYTHAVLALADDDKYIGAGILEPGTGATVIDYVSHGTGTRDYPIIRVKGIAAVVHPRLVDSV